MKNKQNHRNKNQEKNKNRLKKKTFDRNKIIVIVVILAVLTAIYFLFIKKKSNEPEWVKEGEVTFLNKDTHQRISGINVEVASAPAERSQGLMYRTQMDENKGMLFIFDSMEMKSFWMKNTIIPLDIIFIDNKGVINTILKNTTPFSEKSLPSKLPSQFVVEVNGGYCGKYGIKEGDLIEYRLDDFRHDAK